MIPQPPQLFGSTRKFTQAATPASMHAVRPTCAQPHWPTPLTITQLSPVVQTVPQAPQLFWSVRKFTHFPLHNVVPEPHAHKLETQVAPDGQGLPHPPQLFGSLRGLVHAVPPSPSGHVVGSLDGHWHWLLMHDVPPVHAVPHPPQLFESEVVSTHAEPQGI